MLTKLPAVQAKKKHSGILLGWGLFWNKILTQIPIANHVKRNSPGK